MEPVLQKMRKVRFIHAAAYVSIGMAAEHGKIGRSEGCFAVAQSDIALVLEQLGSGRMIYADRLI